MLSSSEDLSVKIKIEGLQIMTYNYIKRVMKMTIAEVSKKFGISSTTLRYYEKIGLMNPVAKNISGHRDYQEPDLRRINFIKCMRAAGMTIEQIKLYVDLFNEGEHTISQRKDIMIEQLGNLEAQVEELQSIISYLKHKIDNYESTLVKREMEQRNKLKG